MCSLQVYIRPNKVVYLPTTFMEENFDPASLPVNCEMIVETDGGLQVSRTGQAAAAAAACL